MKRLSALLLLLCCLGCSTGINEWHVIHKTETQGDCRLILRAGQNERRMQVNQDIYESTRLGDTVTIGDGKVVITRPDVEIQ